MPTVSPRPSKKSPSHPPVTRRRTLSQVQLVLSVLSVVLEDLYKACRVCGFSLAGISLPEGVDPSFLAALPEDIRREVLQNQLGIRPPSRPPAATSLPATTAPVLGGPGVTEVSPEFLAALPPAIQEEVRR